MPAPIPGPYPFATASLSGLVSTVGQAWGGIKTFVNGAIMQGTLTASVIQASAGQTLSLAGSPASSGTAVAAIINASTALITVGAKLLSIRNNGVEKFFVDKDGGTQVNSLVSTGSITAPTLQGPASTVLALLSNQTNGGTAVGTSINTGTNYSTAGAKLVSIQNNAVEKLSIDKDGAILAAAAGAPLRAVGTQANGAGAVGHILDTSTNYTTGGAKLLSIRNNAVEKASFNKDGLLSCSAVTTTGAGNFGSLSTGGSVTGSLLVSSASGIFMSGSAQIQSDTAAQLQLLAGPGQGGTPMLFFTTDAYTPVDSLIDIGDSASVRLQIFGDGTLKIVGGGRLIVGEATDTSLTPTVNFTSGRVRIQAGHSSVTISNSLSTATNKCFVQVVGTPDTTCFVFGVNCSTPGTIVITGNANATSNVNLDFILFNP